ncbi:hypothetical protein DL767_001708 [Monosporascus sp. MG133]|nr:hypothetical protein DL767_001708 [Monosporascus sp. MG133]
MLRRVSLKTDEHVPLYPTVDEIKDIENRRDVQELREQYEALRDQKGAESRGAKRAFGAYAARRRVLQQLVVNDKRQKYFQEVDRRRPLG